MKSRGNRRPGARAAALHVVVAAVATTVGLAPINAQARSIASATPSLTADIAPAAFFKKKKKKKRKKSKKKAPGLTPESAETKRQAIRDSVAADRESNKEAAAQGLEDNAALLGDPVTMKEAGTVRLEIAREKRSIEEAEKSIAVTIVALDILHFYQSVAVGDASSTWLVIAPSSAMSMIADAEAQVEQAEALIAEIKAEQAAAASANAKNGKQADPGKKKRKRGKAKPGTGFIVGGSVATVVGLGGGGLAVAGLMMSQSAQNEVETLGGDPANQPRIDELDKQGGQANMFAYIGVGVAAVGLAVGIPLIIVGAKKRKAAGPSANASVVVTPLMAGKLQGVALSGRF